MGNIESVPDLQKNSDLSVILQSGAGSGMGLLSGDEKRARIEGAGKMADRKHLHENITHMARKVSAYLLTFLAGTIIPSLIYKAIIEMKIFAIIRSPIPHMIVFCLIELLVLGVYWCWVLSISRECRHQSRSPKVYYLRTTIVFILYTAIYWISYFIFGKEVFSWIFRITLNLCAFSLATVFPENLFPYMIAYLIITILVMLLEPVMSKLSHKQRAKHGERQPSERSQIIAELFSLSYVKKDILNATKDFKYSFERIKDKAYEVKLTAERELRQENKGKQKKNKKKKIHSESHR